MSDRAFAISADILWWVAVSSFVLLIVVPIVRPLIAARHRPFMPSACLSARRMKLLLASTEDRLHLIVVIPASAGMTDWNQGNSRSRMLRNCTGAPSDSSAR